MFTLQQPDSTYPVVLSPHIVAVNQTTAQQVNEATFEIMNVSDEDLDLTLVSQPPGYFTLDLPEKIESGKTAECRIKIDANHLDKAFQKSITFEFSDVSKSRFTLPIVQKVLGQQSSTRPVSPGNKATMVTTGKKSGH